MQQSDVPHYEEEGRVNPQKAGTKMPIKEYAIALDYLVFTCVDIAFTHRNQILLAKRNRYPRKSWWITGGRMNAGENPLDTATRKVAEEAQLANVSPQRFRYIGAYSTCFTFRDQKPIENGSHSVNLTYQLELTDTETNQLVLDSEEYETEWKWVELSAVGQWLETTYTLDQCLLRIVQDIQSLERD